MRRDSRICREVLDIAYRLSRWLFKQPEVGEESLTDWLLYEIADRLPFVRYRKFTRPQEARDTGADWEWWFVGRHLSLALRVQAKKIAGEPDYYRALAYTNRYGLQIEKLMSSAVESNFLPLYALYHGTPTPPPIRCKRHKDAGRHEGVFLASAAELYEKFIVGRRVKIDGRDLLQMSITMSSLFCCHDLAQKTGEPVERIYAHIAELLLSSTESKNSNNRLGIHNELPEYISALLRFDQFESDWSDRGYEKVSRDVNAILVFDMREY